MQRDKEELEKQRNQLNNDAKQLQKELNIKSQAIEKAETKVTIFQQQQQEIAATLSKKEQELEKTNQENQELEKYNQELQNSVAKIRELSKVASQLQQENQVNEANQFLNIAGLVLQDKIKNPQLKAVLLDGSLVLGYEYLVNSENLEENQKTQLTAEYQQAQDNFNQSINNLPKDNQLDNQNSDYLATLVYIYYVKGKLEKDENNALVNYKAALAKYNLLKSQLEPNTGLFRLHLNILYNGNADIVASSYRKLVKLDKSNQEYHEVLKAHLLNELDYLMQQRRWQQADIKNWQFLLVSAQREEQGHLKTDDIKNFNCQDLKAVDKLWVKHSMEKFGYSVQKRIYLATGNSLDFDWEREKFTKWGNQEYDRFVETVGWKRNDEWIIHDKLEWKEMKSISTYERMGTLPWYWIVSFATSFAEGLDSGRDYSYLLAETCRL